MTGTSTAKTQSPVLDRLAIWTIDETAEYLRISRRRFDAIRRRDDFPRPMVYDASDASHPRYRACDVIDWCASRIAA